MATSSSAGVLAAPPAADAALLVVAIVAVSTSGPLIAAAAAPALAIAFWRNALATAVLAPFAARRRGELRRLSAREWRFALAAGVLLALHFGCWTTSLQLTSVASATALAATQPVWAAALARAVGEPVPRRAWAGVLLAVVGAGVLSGVDFALTPRSLVGDGLALAAGAFAAGYMAAGAEVRRTASTTTYTTLCYGSTALLLLVACLAGRQALAGYSAATWWKLVALTAGAQLLGHSLFNRVLRTTSPTVVSLAILFEVPGAALLAAIFLGQRPPAAALPAAALLVAGIALVVAAGRAARVAAGVAAEVAE